MNGKLYISCGIPGSGKSTFLKKYVGKDEAIISRDDIRFTLLKEDEPYFSHEEEVYSSFINIIAEHINKGINVYADATHLNKWSRKKLLYSLEAIGCKPSKIEGIFFDIPLSICLERNEKRKGTKTYVPRGVIRRMFMQMDPPIELGSYWQVDEDGTVSHWISG